MCMCMSCLPAAWMDGGCYAASRLLCPDTIMLSACPRWAGLMVCPAGTQVGGTTEVTGREEVGPKLLASILQLAAMEPRCGVVDECASQHSLPAYLV